MDFKPKKFFLVKNFFFEKHLEKFHKFFFSPIQKKFFSKFFGHFQKKKFHVQKWFWDNSEGIWLKKFFEKQKQTNEQTNKQNGVYRIKFEVFFIIQNA